MARGFASEKNALGTCDRCGLTYKLSQLKHEFVNRNKNNLRVCPECFDEDHPQNQLGRMDFSDPQALRDPRIDRDIDASRNDGAVQYNFDSDLDGWSAQIGSATTLTYVSAENAGLVSGGAVNLSGIDSHGITRTNDTKINLDPTVYKIVRIRLRSIVETNKGEWKGRLRWTTDVDSNFDDGPKKVLIDRPVFEQMGEKYHVLSYDLSNHDEWIDTIARVQFAPYSGNGGAHTVYIDYIRFEKR